MAVTDQNFKKNVFYRSETQENRLYRSEIQHYSFFSLFFPSNYFWIQISDFNFSTCSKNRITRSVFFRHVPANGYMSVNGYSDMPSYIISYNVMTSRFFFYWIQIFRINIFFIFFIKNKFQRLSYSTLFSTFYN